MRSVHVAFLRGVNVGGKHSLPMTALAALFTESGCGEVRTYIQSGNVLFTAGTALARRIPALIAAGISKRFGFEAPVVTRTAAGSIRPARQRDLPPVPERSREKQTDGAVFRLEARDHQHIPQLEHRHEDVSTQEFQEWAKTAAIEARALSRILNQYADQADQAVKTLVP